MEYIQGAESTGMEASFGSLRFQNILYAVTTKENQYLIAKIYSCVAASRKKKTNSVIIGGLQQSFFGRCDLMLRFTIEKGNS